MVQSKIYTQTGLLEVINALPLALTVIDQNRRVVLANTMTLTFLNKRECELVGQVGGHAFDCRHYNEVPEGCGFGPRCLHCKLREIVTDTLQNQAQHSMVETTMVFNHAGKRHLRISTLPIALDEDRAALLGIEDVTPTKVHEQTRLEKEKLAAVLETAGAVCHELNQPLMFVGGSLELLLSDLESGDPLRKRLNEIMTQVDRMADITRQLAQISRYETKGYLKERILDLNRAALS